MKHDGSYRHRRNSLSSTSNRLKPFYMLSTYLHNMLTYYLPIYSSVSHLATFH